MDSERYPEAYHRLLKEIAARNKEPLSLARERVEMYEFARPRRTELFQPDCKYRDGGAIAAWWERRRGIYLDFVAVLAFCSMSTWVICKFSLSLYASGSPTTHSIVPRLVSILIALVVALPLLIPILAVSHFAYTLASYLDGALCKPLRFWGWRVSSTLFGSVLAVTLIAVSIPALLGFWTWLHKPQ